MPKKRRFSFDKLLEPGFIEKALEKLDKNTIKKDELSLILKQIISSSLAEESKIQVPISIFNSNLGVLEAISTYFKENLTLSFRQSAFLLNRDERTIWNSYHKAKLKYSGNLDTTSKLFIPL